MKSARVQETPAERQPLPEGVVAVPVVTGRSPLVPSRRAPAAGPDPWANVRPEGGIRLDGWGAGGGFGGGRHGQGVRSGSR